MTPTSRRIILLGLVLVHLQNLGAQVPDYPVLTELNPTKDPLFRQLESLVDDAYQAEASGSETPDLSIFQYQVREGDTIFTLASRFNLPYEALVSLNGFETPAAIRTGRWILVPSQPGLFLALDHPAELDRLVEARRARFAKTGPMVQIRRAAGTEAMLFFPGERFESLERAFFLGVLFRFPLPKGVLTSSFGIRSNPFTGHPTFHAGIDLAAPTGTEIYAARDGTVVETGFSAVYGNFVRLSHGDGYETVYGHMSQILISLHQKVQSGTILGRVGSTGQSTGPHLHFEIRREGHPQNPVPLLPGRL